MGHVSRRYAFLEEHPVIPFAHRGGGADGSENTWEAFESAISLGFRYLETDVRATHDQIPVIGHDDSLLRVFGIDQSITTLSLDELRKVYREHGLGEPVPLKDLLQRWPSVRVNIDIKDQNAVVPTVDVIIRTESQVRVCVASFSEARLRQARRSLGEAVCTAAGPAEVASLMLMSRLGSVGGRLMTHIDAPVIQVPFRFHGIPVATPTLIDFAHAMGVKIHVWTLNSRAEIERALEWQVDGIMSDEPALLKEILAARNLWPGDT